MRAIHEQITNTVLSAGSNTLSSGAVSPGFIQKITNISFSYTGIVPGVRIEIKAGGKSIYKTIADPTSGQLERVPSPVDIYLDPTEKIDMLITNATLNDDASLIIHGNVQST